MQNLSKPPTPQPTFALYGAIIALFMYALSWWVSFIEQLLSR